MCSHHYRGSLEAGESGKRIPCKWPGCEKFYSTKEFCFNHYTRARRLGNFDTPWVDSETEKTPSPCVWPECGRLTASSTAKFCGKCYQRARKMGDFDKPWLTWRPYGVPDVAPKCKWDGCERRSDYAGYCRRDYSRAKRLENFVDPWTEWVTDGECEVCGKEWTNARNRNKRVCSRTCHVKAWRIENPERARKTKMDAVRRRRARVAGVEVDYFTMDDVRLKHGDDCHLCGGEINYKLKFPHPMSPSIDHVKPISEGGPHTLENCAMAHMDCNNRKNASDMPSVSPPTLFSLL